MAKLAEVRDLCGLCGQPIDLGDQVVRSIRDGTAHVDCDAYGVGETW